MHPNLIVQVFQDLSSRTSELSYVSEPMIYLVKNPAKVQVRAAKFVSLVGQSQKLMYGLAAYLALVIVLLNVG
jgi:hypothetical protein